MLAQINPLFYLKGVIACTLPNTDDGDVSADIVLGKYEVVF